MKKVFSLVLTLAMLVSVISSISFVNVSAHQNYKMDTITFDEVSESNSTGYKYGTGNATSTGTYKHIEQSFDGGTFTAYHNSKYYYNDVAEAPDNRYGKSLLVRETWEEGASTQYVQTTLSPNRNLTGTVHVTASLYTEANANDAYIQRGLQFRTKVTGTSYTNRMAVLFSHSGKGISVFDKGTGKTYKTDTWYDMDITYNMDNQQYHVIIYENGVEYINVQGTNTSNCIDNIATMILYHSTADASRNDIKVYWDNLSINSAYKFVIPETALYPTMTFDGLKDQEAGKQTAEGLPSTYTYRFGYQGNTNLPVFKALETDKGTSACVYGPALPDELAAGTAEGQYTYPQWIIYTNQAQFHLKTSVRFKNTKLAGIYLNGQSGAEIMFYGGIKAFGQTLFSSYDTTGNVWYDIDLIMDTSTGYYELTVVKTDDNTTKTIAGFQTKYLSPITDVKFGLDRGGASEATKINESFMWIDDLFVGNYGVDDVESQYTYDFEDGVYPAGYAVSYTGITMEALSAKAGEKGDVNIDFDTADTNAEGFNPDAVDSFAIPFINDKPYYKITAKFTLEDLNSGKLIYFGNLPILEIPTTGNVKCNQSARGKIAVVGNEYTLTHEMQPGCTVSKTSLTGVFADKADVQTIAYGAGRPSGPYDPFKIVVKPTGAAETYSALTLSDILIDVDYKTSSTKNFRIESLATNGVETSIFLPHDKASSGYIYSADLAFNNFDVERTIKIGDNTVATIDTLGNLQIGDEMALLEADTVYEFKINATHGETSTAVVTMADIGTTIDASPYIDITQSAGASLMTIDNVKYESKIPLVITNEIPREGFNVFDDVVVEFSTKLTSITEDMVKVYKPFGALNESSEITEKTVELSEDGKSISISFEKDDLSHYHIALQGLTDVYGNTLTDVVEFTTKLPDLVLTRPGFWRMNGETKEVLNLLTPGEVNVSVKANAYNDTDFDMLFAAAMYNKGVLVDVKATSVTVTEEGVTPTVKLTVPDDGKFYEIKAFTFRKENMKPLGKTALLNFTTDQPIAIIKLDDYGQTAHQPCWDSIVEYAEANNFKMCIGLMGYTLNNNPDQQKAAERVANSPMIEMWCHGYNWQNDRFTSDDPEVQALEFSESNRVAEEAGFEMTSFCAPSNALNELTLQVMTERFPNYNLIMTREDIYKAYAEKYPDIFFMWRGITVESTATGTTDAVEDLKARWNAEKANGAPYLMLQAHPSGWDTNTDSRDRYYEFINWLKDQGVVFMTPSEYLEYSKS
ncbi:MAG: hypothetical protein IJB70_02125 [Clostridia bacterium]|nr:hypothetical protein [Clostridia bacterium]